MIWAEWWIWVVFGLVIAILELFIPGYLFLGFGAGAVLTGVVIATGIVGNAPLPMVLVIFAVLSLVAWIMMRRLLGLRRGQVKRIDRDINEN